MGCFLTICYCYTSKRVASGFFWVATRRNGLLLDSLLLLRVGMGCFWLFLGCYALQLRSYRLQLGFWDVFHVCLINMFLF
jgi:hypothetical protein